MGFYLNKQLSLTTTLGKTMTQLQQPRQQQPAMTCGWLFSIMWFVFLLSLAIPVALVCAILWVLLAPCTACCGGFAQLLNILQSGQHLVLTCSQNMVHGKNPCN